MSLKYEQIETVGDYREFMDNLKQNLLRMVHSNYQIDELKLFLEDFKMENEVLEIVTTYVESLFDREKLPLITTKNKNLETELWFQHYRDFGVGVGFNHFPDLIAFQFQLIAIDDLIQRIGGTSKVKGKLSKLKKELLEGAYTNFEDFMVAYLKEFDVEYLLVGDPRNPKKNGLRELWLFSIKELKNLTLKFPVGHGLGNFYVNKIYIYLVNLRKIIIGARYMKQEDLYIPSIFANKQLRNNIIKYLNARLKFVLTKKHKIFPPKKFPAVYKKAPIYVGMPKVEFSLEAKSIMNWDTIPINFNAGGGVRPMGKARFQIFLHPFAIFYMYLHREQFQDVIDMIIHHEFLHVMQLMYLLVFEDVITNENFKRKFPAEYKFIVPLAKKLWFVEEIPEELKGKYENLRAYVDGEGGHTIRFIAGINKFEPCKRAMQQLGVIETFLASYFFKIWGKTMEKGKWVSCKPKAEESS